NYNITVNNGNGKISAKSLTIKSVPNIPSAPSGVAKSDTVTETITNANLDASTPLASADSTGISIKYTYTYDASTSTSVNISAITSQNANYTITPTSLDNQTGSRNARTVKTITVAPTTTTYNYSDTLSAVTITVEYDDSYGNSVYNNIADAVAAGVSVYWGTDTSAAATDGQTLNVSAHSKNLTAAFGGKTGSAAITVNPLPVIVTVNGTMTKVYDGDTTYDATDNASNTITYSAAIDTTMSGYKASYGTQFTNDNVTATGATVAFNDKDVPDANAAVVSNGTISDTSGNYKVTSTANNVTSASITAKTVNVTAITNVPEIKQYTTGLTGTKTVQTNGSGDVTVTGIQNNETIEVEYGYSYPDSATSGPRNDVNITSCKLTSTYGANKNYTLYSTYPSTGSGSVKARTISAFTVTAPTQFTNSQSTAVLYGTQLDLTGLAVSISYGTSGADGTDVYTWTSSGWTLTQDSGNTESVSSVPFTWGWDDGSQPSQSDILKVANNGKGIKATSTDDPNKSNTSTAVKVDPITIDDITVSYTGDSITKTYDGDNTVDFPSTSYTLTYSSNDILSGDASSVTITATYVYPNVNYNASAYTLTPTWGLAAANANYKFADSISVTNPLKGTITQRPIKVTAVSGIAAINQYDDISNPVSVSSDTNATFSAVDGVTESGLIGTGKPEILYSYQYSKNTPAGTDNAVRVTGIAFVSGGDNYQLNNTELTATGTINPVNASAITITGTPTQLNTGADVQYGDTLSLSGLAVKVGYGTGGTTHEDTYTYDGTNWKKGTDTVADGDLPFTLSWSGTSHSHGDTLNTVNTTGDKLTAALKDDSTKTADVGTLVVNKRKVTVTPKFKTGVSQLTKIYDGGTSYTNNGDIEFTVASVSSYTGTLPTVTGATYA
ncbi:MAG: hypothetical protein MR413_08990, partial [Clostridia bacterium]|nr:hypothetical protein [Clostridia bacterium]